MVTIAQISDLHVGSPFFVPNLMNRVIVELNELQPDVVVCTGDLTNEGYRQEYKNWLAYRERIQGPGPREGRGGRSGGADSSEPNINEAQIGRERSPWIREQFAVQADLKIFAVH